MNLDTIDLLASLGATSTVEEAVGVVDTAVSAPSSHYSPGVTTSIEEKALSLLGSGVQAEAVAAALGVTPSRISQLLAEESFSSKVSALRYDNLQKHNRRDDSWDSLEDKLLTKLDSALPLLIRPTDIVNAIKVVNNANRRGQSAPDQITSKQNIVQIVMPSIVADKFTVNINNQVTKAGEQDLLTMPSGNLLKQVEDATAERLEQLPAETETTEDI